MATGIANAERIPDGDYSVAHRAPPPVPLAYAPTATTSATASSPPPRSPQLVNPPAPPSHASEAASLRSASGERHHRRRGSFGALLRRTSSNQSSLRQQQSHPQYNASGEDVPPVPNIPAPATRIAQAQQAAAHDRAASLSSTRKVSTEGGRTMLRKSSKLRAQQEQQRLEEERLARQMAPPPRLPSHNPLPGIASFGGADADHDNIHNGRTNFSRPYGGNMSSYDANQSSSSPAYAVRAGASPKPSGEYVDRAESMTNRGRYSYASSTVGVNVSSPRRVRRRKDPTPFNVLVIGAKNSGKTSFISFLRHSLALSSAKLPSHEPDETINASKSTFTSHYLETEMDGERVGVTLWDSAGLEKNIVDLQLREMAAFVESKFEETFVEEQKVMRSPGVKDTHIHCVFLVLDPVRLDATVASNHDGNLANVSGLDDDLDLQVMRSLWGKSTVIPVISKADTLTIGHMAFLKRAVWQSIRTAKMDPLEALELEDDSISEEDEDQDEPDLPTNNSDENEDSEADARPTPKSNKRHSHRRESSLTAANHDDETPYIPMSVLSPDPYDLPPYNNAAKKGIAAGKVGRRFAWGVADPYNAAHCDFTRLRDSIFVEWRAELRELSRTRWYEGWRTSRLRSAPASRRAKGPSGVGSIGGPVPNEGRAMASSDVPRTAGLSGPLSKAERVMGLGGEVNGNGTYGRSMQAA